jgi:hypothetical protein
MTLQSLAEAGYSSIKLPEWSSSQYLQLSLIYRLGGFGFGNWVDVYGFSPEPIRCPVYIFEVEDNERWEPTPDPLNEYSPQSERQ